ncbi:hypothetical protein FIBSPDRAFT_867204 [Athelia psychrophila]|uniref:Uncharacterized protein n=1 Tax=Athelia psychrophila TaxID=1759441 RepID=A0A166E728_9AGAM|nr:hypothetical protein FIBSPDRAFT_867204 [Fibularhizoctonia sp. CBS 109695]
MAVSLSRVSKSMRNASASVRFQSVTCKDSHAIIGLTYALERVPPHQRIMRHLFVSSAPRHPSGRTINFSSHPNYQTTTNKASPARDGSAHYGILRILTLVAPTLHSLSIVAPNSTWAQLPLPACFPVLVELSIQHEFSGGCLSPAAFGSLRAAPSLKRLVLLGFLRVMEPLQLRDTIDGIAPALTHLRLPVDGGNVERLIRRLCAEVCSNARVHVPGMVQSHDHSTVQDIKTTGKSLEALFLGTAGQPTCIMARGEWRIVCAQVNPHGNYGRIDRPGEMYTHWFARLEGREGYWKEDFAGVAREELNMPDLRYRL